MPGQTVKRHSPVTPISIRQADPCDAASLAALATRTFVDAFAAFNKPEDLRQYLQRHFTPEQLERELADPRSTFFLAEAGSQAVAYAKMRDGEVPACVSGERPIEIHRLYALADWHGRGIGPALMNACLDRARQSGRDTVWLAVWDRNPRARNFYRKCGFTDAGSKTFQFGSDAQIDVVMQIRV
jgi:GNAT superfamily N-acetyltransferase